MTGLGERVTQVTQVDRDAAADYAANSGWGDGREYWLANALDSHPLIQAFARHREQAVQEAVAERDARIAELEAVAVDVAASLAAAISLLQRGGKAAKKAAPSDKMFDQMVRDYQASLGRARAALKEIDNAQDRG